MANRKLLLVSGGDIPAADLIKAYRDTKSCKNTSYSVERLR